MSKTNLILYKMKFYHKYSIVFLMSIFLGLSNNASCQTALAIIKNKLEVHMQDNSSAKNRYYTVNITSAVEGDYGKYGTIYVEGTVTDSERHIACTFNAKLKKILDDYSITYIDSQMVEVRYNAFK